MVKLGEKTNFISSFVFVFLQHVTPCSPSMDNIKQNVTKFYGKKENVGSNKDSKHQVRPATHCLAEMSIAM